MKVEDEYVLTFAKISASTKSTLGLHSCILPSYPLYLLLIYRSYISESFKISDRGVCNMFKKNFIISSNKKVKNYSPLIVVNFLNSINFNLYPINVLNHKNYSVPIIHLTR